MKKLLVSLTLLAIIPLWPLQAQTDRPKVAVVLSGGGAKGFAHIGALRVIEEAGFPIDIITGTSMGSLIGALYSIGYTTDQLDSLVRAQDWVALFTDRTDPRTLTLRQRQEQNTYAFIRGLSNESPERGGLIRGRNLNHLFRQLCTYYLDSISFDSLPIPFACVATDIVSNTEVDFHSGSLVKAMRASMAIPGVFTPVRWGDSVLVDGGLQNNYPADIARQMGADIVIGVSVQSPDAKAGDLKDAGSVMNQIINVNCKKKFTDNIALSDIFIQVDVSGYGAASFTSSAIDTLIRRGGEAAQAQWNRLLALRHTAHIDSTLPRKAILLPPMATANSHATQPPARVPVASVGFRFDTEEMGALQLNAKLPIPTHTPMALQGTLRLGHRNLARIEASMSSHLPGLNPTLAYTFRNYDLDIYEHSTRTYNVRYRQHSIDLTPFDMRLKLYDLHAGLCWDYYNFYGQLLAANGTITPPTDGHYLTAHAEANLNTEDDWYFPSHGTRFTASYAYHMPLFDGWQQGAGLNDIEAHWRINIATSEHLTLQPMLYARMLPWGEVPLAFINMLGGEVFGHYVEQQMPFAGIGHIEPAGRYLMAIQLQLQYHLLSNHWILLQLASGYHTNAPQTFHPDHMLFGIQAGYTYNSFIGPIGALVGYSNRTHEPYLYINIGHIF